jgi:hypothetical protein
LKLAAPEEHEYEQLTNIWNELEMEKEPSVTEFRLQTSLLVSSVTSFCMKPSGPMLSQAAWIFRRLPGHRFYLSAKINEDKRFQKWDRYFQAQDAARAVRNRKNYFV